MKKTIYVVVRGKDEQVVFSASDSHDSVVSAFRSAAAAPVDAILTLRGQDGALLPVGPSVPANTPKSRHTLDIVEPYSGRDVMVQRARLARVIGHCSQLVEDLSKHAGTPQNSMNGPSAQTGPLLLDFRQSVETLKRSLEDAEHLSLLGLERRKPFPIEQEQRTVAQEVQHVNEQIDLYLSLSVDDITPETREALKRTDFSNWPWTDAEIMLMIEYFFHKLGLVERFNIDKTALQTFVIRLRQNYNNNPFHNFSHCFCVTQMMYAMIEQARLYEKLPPDDILALIVASSGHDLDHPGFNNDFQINAQTELALRYNDMSPLEHHHCYMAFQILSEPQANLLSNMSAQAARDVRQAIISCILATDMKQHRKTIEAYQQVQPALSLDTREHRIRLMQILIKSADISNEVRPAAVAEPWADRLLQEFYQQADYEKSKGLPFAPMMDREKTDKAKSQIGFIKFVIVPLFEVLCATFPDLRPCMLEPALRSLKYYEDMDAARSHLQATS
eukprot:comp22553_c0_seq1/m.34318 comp22553_c0_seq1/g.34318  ORF comp22553_c0_seq1/g.34318 comp22553_c0_seq1/m.34318 type:complete len:503 (-) comp22553_c0_seq1:193-1701(-)